MKTFLAALALLGLLLILNIPSTALAQGTAFTYQGQLDSGGAPANGSYDFAFTLYTTNVTGSPIAGPVTNNAVGVTNGLFTTTIDFGNVFFGTSNWLDIAVSAHGANTFTTLAPRQQLTPVPYAITAANVSGAISLGQLPAGVLTNGATGVNVSGAFSGNGSGLSNVVAGSLAGSIEYQATNVYSTNGTYTFTVPSPMNVMQVKLWGSGGGTSDYNEPVSGGAGAYASATLAVSPGETFVVVVGRNGGGQGNSGSNDGSGGSSPGGGYGGQASSLFQFTGSDYIMKAVAGGGGGGGALEVGGDGIANGSGSGYSTNATTTGETNLDLMGGAGGAGGSSIGFPGGGGGGGYGGGAGGTPGNGGSGGGSYGTTTIGGSGGVPGNTSDPAYLSPSGYANNDGLAVVTYVNTNVAVLSSYIQAGGFVGNGNGLTNLSAAALPSSVVTNNETGVTLAGAFSGNGSGLTNISATALPSSVVTNNETGVTLGGTFSGNGHGLASLNTTNLAGTLQSGNFAATTVTNFPDAAGPLPATNSFASHGGRLLITTSGSGTTTFAGTTISMTVELDGAAIGTNFVYVTTANTHTPFISKTFVQTGVAAGNHTIILAVPSSTITTFADTFNVTVQELPY